MTTAPARRPLPRLSKPAKPAAAAPGPVKPAGEQLADKVFAFSIELTYIVIGGVLWLVCSLPIFTIGAASAGLHALILGHRVGGRREYARPFFAAFRASFKQVTLPWLLLLVLLVLFGFDAWFYLVKRQGTATALLLGITQLVLLAAALVVATYLTALVAIDVDDALGGPQPRTRPWIVQAGVCALDTWWWALAVLAVTVAVPAVFWWLGAWQFSIFAVGVIVWFDDWILAKALRDSDDA